MRYKALLLSANLEAVVGFTLAVEAALSVLFVATNVRIEVVAHTACFIQLRTHVVATTHGVPKVSQEGGFLARALGPLVECYKWATPRGGPGSLGYRGYVKCIALPDCPGLVARLGRGQGMHEA